MGLYFKKKDCGLTTQTQSSVYKKHLSDPHGTLKRGGAKVENQEKRHQPLEYFQGC